MRLLRVLRCSANALLLCRYDPALLPQMEASIEAQVRVVSCCVVKRPHLCCTVSLP